MNTLSKILRVAVHGEPPAEPDTEPTGEFVDLDAAAISPPPPPTSNQRWRRAIQDAHDQKGNQ